jgi:hypothetical protein
MKLKKKIIEYECIPQHCTGAPWSEPDTQEGKEGLTKKFPVRYAVIRMFTTGRKRTLMSTGTVTIAGIPSNTVTIKVTRELKSHFARIITIYRSAGTPIRSTRTIPTQL